MIQHYLITCLRLFNREKLYVFINLLGLSLSLGCCLVLGLYVNHETSYDRHQANRNNVYRLVDELVINGRGGGLAWSSESLGPLLQLDNPERIRSYVRFKAVQQDQSEVFRFESTSFYWDKVFFTDSPVFEVFTHTVIYGDPTTALVNPNTIAISRSLANAYFGEASPIGKTLSSDTADYQVTLVFDDLPTTSHLKYDALISMSSRDLNPLPESALNQQLADLSLYTYVMVNAGVSESELSSMLARLTEERLYPLADQFGLEEFSARIWPQNLSSIHLRSDVAMDEPTGNIFAVFGGATVAVFILLIGCFNYVNLSTSRYFKRARAVGMRKVLGAGRLQLVIHFLSESVLFVLVALVLALGVVTVLLKTGLTFDLFGAPLDPRLLFEPAVLPAIILFSLCVGIASGIYPSIYLSSVSAHTALGRGSRISLAGDALRQVLVLAQFTVSMAVIASALIMTSQMRFISDSPLGFVAEKKLLVTLRGADLIETYPALREQLLRDTGITSVAITQHLPGSDLGYYGVSVESEEGNFELQSAALMAVGSNFIETLGIPLVAGRGFPSSDQSGFQQGIIVNEAFVEQMRWQQPIGKGFRGFVDGKVIGVVENFNFDSLYNAVTPLILQPLATDFADSDAQTRAFATQTIIVGLAGSRIDQALDYVAATMALFDHNHPFEFEFLDDRLDQLYASEQDTIRLTTVFASVCIFISCLGLFGLAAFTSEQRTKEFGIRKVLGASGWRILWLLLKNILILMFVASAIATAVTYLAMNNWLESFAYRASINPMLMVFATVIVLLVAIVTVSYHALRVARANPIDALRYE